MDVKEYLTKQGVPFEVIEHRPTFETQRMAAVLHVSGRNVVKTVLLILDRGFRAAVALLPTTHTVDCERVSNLLGGASVEIATENRLAEYCHGCEVGALPPFGHFHAAITIADELLAGCDEIVFEGSTHHEAIRMKWEDFVRLESPLVGNFAVPSSRADRVANGISAGP
jgi:Ala-tRNA(Pro) deacylase